MAGATRLPPLASDFFVFLWQISGAAHRTLKKMSHLSQLDTMRCKGVGGLQLDYMMYFNFIQKNGERKEGLKQRKGHSNADFESGAFFSTLTIDSAFLLP